MSSPHHIESFEFPKEFILPEGIRLYTPPRGREMAATIVKPFRPMHEASRNTRTMMETMLAPSLAAEAAAREAQTVDFTSYVPETPPPSFPDNALPVEDPAANTKDTIEGVLFIEEDGTYRYLNLEAHPKKDGVFIALDPDDRPLVDKSGPRGKEILTDENGYILPPKPNLLNRIKHGLANSDGAQGDDKPVTAYTAEGIPLGDFDVVGVGRVPTDGRGRRSSRVMTYAVGVLTAVAVGAGIAGVLYGRSAVPAEGQITPEEAVTYNLAQFPTNAAAAFGEHYLTLCLTHPQYREDIESRNQMLAGMEAPGVAANCGWEKGGEAVAVNSVTFNGQVEEREEYSREDGSRVAYMGFFVSMSNGRQFTATLPIWSGYNDQERPAYSIVGNLGLSAATAVGTQPDMSLDMPADRELAGTIQPVLSTFFNAWAESDAEALNAILTSSATGEARAGLNGIVSDPQFSNITVYPYRSPDEVQGDTATWNYQEGDEVIAMVNLKWRVSDAASGYEQPTGYRVELVLNDGKWNVKSLQSSVVVSGNSGGAPNENNATGNVGGGYSGGEDSLTGGGSTGGGSGSTGGGTESSPALSGGFSDSNSGKDSDDADSGDSGTGVVQQTPGATANESMGGA